MKNNHALRTMRYGVLFAGMAVLLLGLAAAYSEADDVRTPHGMTTMQASANTGRNVIPEVEPVIGQEPPRLVVDAGSPHDLVLVGQEHVHDGATVPQKFANANYLWRMAYCGGLPSCNDLLKTQPGQQPGPQKGTVKGKVPSNGTIPGPGYTPPATGLYVLELSIGANLSDMDYTVDRVVNTVVDSSGGSASVAGY